MSLQTLNDILLVVCKNRRERVMLQKRASGWVPISSAEIYRNVVGVARALESWGIDHGDRVAILSENRPEWTITDFAALALGAVTVPIYSTQTADQTSYILNDSGARVIAVSTKSQLEKILAIQRHTALERIIVMGLIRRLAMRHSMPARARFCPTTLLPSFTPQARPALRRG
jgi:long-chain acyl-CoA synthetase